MVILISAMAVVLFVFSSKISNGLKTETAMDEMVKGIIRLVMVTDDYMAYPYERKTIQWHTQYRKVETLVHSHSKTDSSERLQSKLELLNKLFEKLKTELRINRQGPVIERIMGRMRWVSHYLINQGYEIISEKNQHAATLQRNSNLILFSISLLLVVVSVLTSLLTIRSVVAPLKRLTEDADRIRTGNFEHIPDKTSNGVIRGNEFAILSQAFYAMTGRLAQTIENLRSSETALQKSDQILNNAIDNAPIGMLLLNPDGHFFRINRAFHLIIGYSQEELSQKTFQDITHPDDHEIGAEAVRKLLDGKTESAALQKRYIHKDGRTLHIQLTTTLLKDPEGNPLYFFSQAVDITEKKEKEEAFRINRELLNQALEGAGAGIWEMNLNTNALFLDKRFLEMMGYRHEDLSGTLQDNLHHPDDWEAVMARLDAHLKGRTPIYISEHRALSKSGEWRWLHARAKVVEWNENGTPLKLVGTAHDITEKKQQEEELKQHREHLEELVEERTSALESTNLALEAANTELKDFAYIVSHDLKAPLRAVSQLSYWIREDHGDKLGDEGKEQISLLINRVKRMDGLINGILQYSRIGRTREKKEKIDLNTLVHRVLGAISSPKEIDIAILNSLPTITSDPIRIEQVFQNLLSNAIKFMDKPNGIIRIKCKDEESWWRFSVKDNGPGINPKYHDRIFKIFQTLSSRDEQENTGIGLTLVKKIVELYGGKVWVESEQGEGSTFFFTLPKG